MKRVLVVRILPILAALGATTAFMGQGCSQSSSILVDHNPKLYSPSPLKPSASSLEAVQPALAVRAMGCANCHASIAGNVVTDFGYGDSAYFYTNAATNMSWNSNSIYGDHGQSWSSANVSATSTVYVPQADLPSVIQSYFSNKVLTIEDYMNYELGKTPIPPTVISLSDVYIGAPTVDQIQAAAGVSHSYLYRPDGGSTVGLTGLSTPGAGVYIVDGAFSCSGDLFLNGTLLLSNAKLTTDQGCRIYATGSVFISGPITYAGASQFANLQISSSRAISLGLGTFNSSCDAAETTEMQNYAPGDTDSIAVRFRDNTLVPGYLTRDGIAPATRGQAVMDDGAAIRAFHPLQDSICESTGRGVTFQHLLLNAPNVQSRYNANFSGVIVSEIFLGALGSLEYTFDPVFTNVPILPALSSDIFFRTK